jgi:hypothetical protein
MKTIKIMCMDDLALTQKEVNAYWEEGYRPFEIYVYNDEPVDYHCGRDYSHNPIEAGQIAGWDIYHVFAKRDELTADYPYFDIIITTSVVGDCTEMLIIEE